MSSQSWRAYGGTQHFESNNHATFHSLVVDNLTLKSQYLGFLDINGTLLVNGEATFNDHVIVNAQQDIHGSLVVAGGASFANDVSFVSSLAVGGNIVVDGSVEAKGVFRMDRDLLVGGNIYVANQLLALGYNFTSSPQNDHAILSGSLLCNSYHEGGCVGVNFPYLNPVMPGATVDIYNDGSFNPTTTTALNVFSTGKRTQSVLSSNFQRQGAVVYTDVSQCSLHLFCETPFQYEVRPCEFNTDVSYTQYASMTDASTNVADATIVYRKGGEMTITSPQNVAFPSHLSIGKCVTETNDVVLLDRGIGHTVFQETVVVYSDVSFAHLPNYYSEGTGMAPGYTAQSALTMVAYDSDQACHTGMSMLTHQGLGMRAIGGSYMYDSGRAMSAQGLTLDACATWIPTQTTVQNLTAAHRVLPAYCRSVTGINTYAPPLDRFAMMVNGPMKVTHAEINWVLDVSFEIYRVVASARNSNTVVTFGNPSTRSALTNRFTFSFGSSDDGGQSWSFYQTPHVDNLSYNFPNQAKGGVVYDSTSALIGLNYGGHLFVSSDALQSWSEMVLAYDNSGTRGFANGVEAIQVMDVDAYSNLIAMVDISYVGFAPTGYNLGYVYLGSSTSFSYSTDVGADGLYHRQFQNDASSTFLYAHFPTGMNSVHALDGFDTSYVFVAGSGIAKYPIVSVKNGGGAVMSSTIGKTSASTWRWNGSYTYRAMKTYRTYTRNGLNVAYLNAVDPLFTIFVGDGIITTTRDGGRTFTDVTSGFTGITFTDVTIYDASRALVTGKDANGLGVLYATYNGGTLWSSPLNVLNDSGTANLLLSSDVSRNLVSLAQIDVDNFLVARVVSGTDASNGTFGSSKMYYCHVPNLFHRSSVVLDVCGSVLVSGSMTVEDNLAVGGVITCPVTTIQSDYRLKTNVVPLDAVDDAVVDHLRPVQYTNELTGRTDVGFLAHEVAEQFPFLVYGEKDVSGTYQSLNYVGMIGILMKEVQELKRTVARLRAAAGNP